MAPSSGRLRAEHAGGWAGDGAGSGLLPPPISAGGGSLPRQLRRGPGTRRVGWNDVARADGGGSVGRLVGPRSDEALAQGHPGADVFDNQGHGHPVRSDACGARQARPRPARLSLLAGLRPGRQERRDRPRRADASGRRARVSAAPVGGGPRRLDQGHRQYRRPAPLVRGRGVPLLPPHHIWIHPGRNHPPRGRPWPRPLLPRGGRAQGAG